MSTTDPFTVKEGRDVSDVMRDGRVVVRVFFEPGVVTEVRAGAIAEAMNAPMRNMKDADRKAMNAAAAAMSKF